MKIRTKLNKIAFALTRYIGADGVSTLFDIKLFVTETVLTNHSQPVQYPLILSAHPGMYKYALLYRQTVNRPAGP
jgi:hypothetical protein